MTVINFALLGIGSGAIYAIISQGMVLIYRGSGVLNLAQAAFVMLGAYGYYEATGHGWPRIVGILFGISLAGLLGTLLYVFIFRSMADAAPMLKVVVTLGVMVSLQSAAVIRYGTHVRSVPSILPGGSVKLFTGVRIPVDRIYLLAIAVAGSALLWSIYKFTAFGRATSAVAENPAALQSLGHSADRIAGWNWAIGCGISGAAGALLAPVTYLEPTNLVLLILPAVAAALFGGFASFPLSLVGGLVIGMGESLLGRYVTSPGWSQSVPVLIVIVVLVFKGSAIPTRGEVFDRLPRLGTGRTRWYVAAPLIVVLVLLVSHLSSFKWTTAVAITMIMMLLCLSLVVVTGYAGQISLAQYVLAGLAAFAGAELSASAGWPFVWCWLAATGIAMSAGLAIGLTAIRSRGLTLAIATTAFALLIYNVILNNYNYAGDDGILIRPPNIVGINLDPATHGSRYASFILIVLAAACFMVANLRRGRSGRRLIAVRSNERAAAALGVNTRLGKLYAFTIGAGLAGTAGVMYGFLQSAIIPSQFDPLSSIGVVTSAALGGIGGVVGGLVGGLLLPGGVLSTWLHPYDGVDRWLTFVSGIGVVLTLRFQPDGLFFGYRDLLVTAGLRVREFMGSRMAPRLRRSTAEVEPVSMAVRDSHKIARVATLSISDLSVSFGGVQALANVSLTVGPGQIHGLIGPNGAGKTTLVDAITGFVRTRSGDILLGDESIVSWPPYRRSQAGLGRSFQSLELFDDLSVADNLAIASDDGGLLPYVKDLVAPGAPILGVAAREAVTDFALEAVLEVSPSTLPYGQRRMIAMARAMAGDPSVLLLDEPAAGLGSVEAAELGALIKRVSHEWGVGVLLIEHNLDLVLEICDRVTVLVQGSVLTSGTADQVRQNPDVIDAYLGVHPPVTTQQPDGVSTMSS